MPWLDVLVEEAQAFGTKLVKVYRAASRRPALLISIPNGDMITITADDRSMKISAGDDDHMVADFHPVPGANTERPTYKIEKLAFSGSAQTWVPQLIECLTIDGDDAPVAFVEWYLAVTQGHDEGDEDEGEEAGDDGFNPSGDEPVDQVD